MTPASSSRRTRRKHGGAEMSARRASSTFVNRPSICNSSRMRRSMASRIGASSFLVLIRSRPASGQLAPRGEIIFRERSPASEGLEKARGIALRICLTRAGYCSARAGSILPLGVWDTPGEATMDRFVECWEGLEDPRTGNAGLHDFYELLIIALCAVLCGGHSAVDMALFAKAKEPFLRGFLELANGLPSHDTFSRLFRLLDPAQFGAAFQRFMARFSETIEGVVAIDGKVVRRSFDHASGKSALHMVSAWGCEQRLVLAQVATD